MATRVLFVCLGNICRSPMGHGILEHLTGKAGLGKQIVVDSAGTGAWHIGEPPDPRTIEVARDNGIDIAGQRARKVRDKDFEKFDLIVAMDRENLRVLKGRSKDGHDGKIRMLREWDPLGPGDVPDPYFGEHGFQMVFEMVERSCRALLEELRTSKKA